MEAPGWVDGNIWFWARQLAGQLAWQLAERQAGQLAGGKHPPGYMVIPWFWALPETSKQLPARTQTTSRQQPELYLHSLVAPRGRRIMDFIVHIVMNVVICVVFLLTCMQSKYVNVN